MLNCFDPDTGEFDFIKGLMKPSADGSYTFGLANMINPEIDDIGPMVEVEEDEVIRRKKYRRVDWTKTFWCIQYVLDEKGEWSDTTHRNGKLFRTRFARNWTFDDLYEATGISRQCHAVFFPKFVKWYATDVIARTIHDTKFHQICIFFFSGQYDFCFELGLHVCLFVDVEPLVRGGLHTFAF